jgi:hypothetical protein
MVGQVSHIGESAPDRLFDMTVADYGEMVRKYRIRVDADVIFAALPAFELHYALFGRTIGLAEETAAGLDGGGINLGGRRADSLRIVLEGHFQPPDGQHPCLRTLEAAEVGGGHRPDRKLVAYEFLYFTGLAHLILASSSKVRMLSL